MRYAWLALICLSATSSMAQEPAVDAGWRPPELVPPIVASAPEEWAHCGPPYYEVRLSDSAGHRLSLCLFAAPRHYRADAVEFPDHVVVDSEGQQHSLPLFGAAESTLLAIALPAAHRAVREHDSLRALRPAQPRDTVEVVAISLTCRVCDVEAWISNRLADIAAARRGEDFLHWGASRGDSNAAPPPHLTSVTWVRNRGGWDIALRDPAGGEQVLHVPRDPGKPSASGVGEMRNEYREGSDPDRVTMIMARVALRSTDRGDVDERQAAQALQAVGARTARYLAEMSRH